MKIEIIKYNENWPQTFFTEAKLLINRLGDVVNNIHHIGSTSVPGLAAKPIIDILMEVTSLLKLDNLNSVTESLGYEVRGEFGIPGRRYFRKGGETRSHQIHAFESRDHNILRHLAFRDYLIAYPGVARKYEDLKRELAQHCNDNINCYCEGKDEFIKFIETKAVEWVKKTNV